MAEARGACRRKGDAHDSGTPDGGALGCTRKGDGRTKTTACGGEGGGRGRLLLLRPLQRSCARRNEKVADGREGAVEEIATEKGDHEPPPGRGGGGGDGLPRLMWGRQTSGCEVRLTPQLAAVSGQAVLGGERLYVRSQVRRAARRLLQLLHHKATGVGRVLPPGPHASSHSRPALTTFVREDRPALTHKVTVTHPHETLSPPTLGAPNPRQPGTAVAGQRRDPPSEDPPSGTTVAGQRQDTPGETRPERPTASPRESRARGNRTHTREPEKGATGEGSGRWGGGEAEEGARASRRGDPRGRGRAPQSRTRGGPQGVMERGVHRRRVPRAGVYGREGSARRRGGERTGRGSRDALSCEAL